MSSRIIRGDASRLQKLKISSTSGVALNTAGSQDHIMGLNVVSNNLANLNTVGFKSSNVNFTDVLGQMFSVAGTPQSGTLMSIGLGAQVGSVRRTMGQGSIQTTSNPLDVAIEGKGFFVVRNTGGQYYTRAGNLHLDANGTLVTDNGSQVQGYLRNPATGQIDNTLGLGAISLPANVNNPVPTSMVRRAGPGVGADLRDRLEDRAACFPGDVHSRNYGWACRAHAAASQHDGHVGAAEAVGRNRCPRRFIDVRAARDRTGDGVDGPEEVKEPAGWRNKNAQKKRLEDGAREPGMRASLPTRKN